MFNEFFNRAVLAGLITESQKDALMEFAKAQPVTSFVASRPTLNPAPADEIPAETPILHNQFTVRTEIPARPHRVSGGNPTTAIFGSLLLALVATLIGAWAVGYDRGPFGNSLRRGMTLLPLHGSLSDAVPPVGTGYDADPLNGSRHPVTLQVD